MGIWYYLQMSFTAEGLELLHGHLAGGVGALPQLSILH